MIYTLCVEHGQGEAVLIDEQPVCPACFAEYGEKIVKHQFFRLKSETKGKVIPFPKRKKEDGFS